MYVTSKSLKGWHKRDFAVLPVKFNLSKDVCCKVSLCENFRRQIVATSFIYLMVHRWIAGDVPICIKFALKVTHTFRKRRLRQLSLNSATTMRASEKVQLSLLGSRQCAFHRAIDEPCALTLSRPKGGSKGEFLHIFAFCVAFNIFVAGNRRYFKFGMRIDHSKPQPTDDTLSLKWAWLLHVIHFKFQVTKHIGNRPN